MPAMAATPAEIAQISENISFTGYPCSRRELILRGSLHRQPDPREREEGVEQATEKDVPTMIDTYSC